MRPARWWSDGAALRSRRESFVVPTGSGGSQLTKSSFLQDGEKSSFFIPEANSSLDSTPNLTEGGLFRNFRCDEEDEVGVGTFGYFCHFLAKKFQTVNPNEYLSKKGSSNSTSKTEL